MALLACPSCKRVYDGVSCLACGYEPPPAAAATTTTTTPGPAGADDLEASFFDSPPTDHGHDEDAPGEVIEELTLGELLAGIAGLPEQVRVLAEVLEHEGRFSEARTLERAREVLLRPQQVIVEGADGIGTDVKDGDERVRDDSGVVEVLELGELLSVKARLSSKVATLAAFLANEGRVGESEIVRRVQRVLERIDAAKSDLDRRL